MAKEILKKDKKSCNNFKKLLDRAFNDFKFINNLLFLSFFKREKKQFIAILICQKSHKKKVLIVTRTKAEKFL
ncbi:hypothetical protein [Bartonella grahamii]|uniref:hypothetical protein n=1 Tax=Bartonella grahamii TaxID=33045 RepID=UPI00031F174F|nr:hypothetical protein [Bartonella grahamii]